MARKTDRERVAEWQKRVESANKVYEKWETKYRCKDLWEYYLGHQWSYGEERDEKGNFRYVVNLVFPRIETQLPALLFYHPKYHIRPSPTLTEDPGSMADARAQLQEETLNALVRNPRLHFKGETFLALLESKFRFGIVEVGYSGNWIDNPDSGKPVLNEKGEEQNGTDGNVVLGGAKIIKSESLYFKRIPAKQFRVGLNPKNQLERCDWFGYWEWHYPSDLKKNPRYRNTGNIKTTGKMADEVPESSTEEEQSGEEHKMCRVWKVFDLRKKVRIDWAEGNDKFLLEEDMDLWEDDSPVVPFAALCPHPRLDEWYPLPSVYNWVPLQDELNETRDGQRIHRKRFKRMFTEKIGALDDTERAKWVEGQDGTLLKVTMDNAITPIPDAPLDPTVVRNIPQTKEDFREVSGVSGEQLSVPEATTATQANIIDINSRIRETKAKNQVSEWLATIGILALYYLRKRMVLPLWIKMNVDAQAPLAAAFAEKVKGEWIMIQKEDLDGVESEITVDVESIAPSSEASERQDWIQALQVVTDPVRGPILLANEVLMRKTMRLFKITNEKEIQSLKQFGIEALQMMMAAQQAQPSGATGGAGPGPTPDNAAIAEQLQRQIPSG